jgi:hypothetical protein
VLPDLLKRHPAVLGDVDDVEVRIGLDDLADQPAHQRAVVDHEDGLARRCGRHGGPIVTSERR